MYILNFTVLAVFVLIDYATLVSLLRRTSYRRKEWKGVQQTVNARKTMMSMRTTYNNNNKHGGSSKSMFGIANNIVDHMF